ncbi:TetR/AcrR family transcriptional regulator [Pediococcus acidilactici]|uniref:TetR/AcrR family transcriptional regulator n=1 Tax=Pediococcus acidilactici TaxID=1254 RepID=A0AAW8YRX8_PEDAC|nr:TetR/AcrR family transcriptional regulator [Pediococcus acidilactici]MDV2912122.1 TetR/AcrR family transcriptional regulator [Pediococcus acidilactici]WQS17414.1 TetR/AcrR family transcriptional regulator [Pediococcus acidilactici]
MLSVRPDVPKDPAKVSRIMQSATHIFALEGYQQAKTADIAKAADVSKGIVFRYFGDKGHLFLATVQYVIERLTDVADFKVWQDAQDLSDMISRALRYKISLQLEYPDEFRLSIRSFSEMSVLPDDVQAEMAQYWQTQTTMSVDLLEKPVLDRMPIRDDIDQADLQRLLNAVTNQVFADSQKFMTEHLEADIEDFEPFIQQIRSEYRILEHGFLK